MAKTFFTPGPAQLYPTVNEHLQKAFEDDILSISHRSKRFQQIYADTISNLRNLLKIPKTHKIYFLSSGTEAMERVIQNCVFKHSFHFVNGAFSKRFFKTSQELGKKAKALEMKAGEGFNFDKVKIPKSSELICITHNETSTGVTIPIESISELKKRFPDKLLAVDTVSSTPGVDFNFGVPDAVFFSVQKGFGLPAGLAVLIISPKAFKKALTLIGKNISTGSYHSFVQLEKYGVDNQTPETPNVLAIYLLGKVCRDMLDRKIKDIRYETEEKAKLIYDFFEKKKGYKIFVKDKNFRSKTVVVVEVTGGATKLIDKLKTKGIIISSGYGEYRQSQVRIASFPAHGRKDILQLLGSI